MRDEGGTGNVRNPITSQTTVQAENGETFKSQGLAPETLRLVELRRPRLMARRRVKARELRKGVRERTEDLRRTPTRLVAEYVAARRELLPVEERALVEQVFVQGRAMSDLAALTGTTTRGMRRRVKKVVERITARTFDLVAFHSAGWPTVMIAVGTAVYIRGRTIRQAAAELGLPYRAALVHAKAIKAVASSPGTARQRRGEAA